MNVHQRFPFAINGSQNIGAQWLYEYKLNIMTSSIIWFLMMCTNTGNIAKMLGHEAMDQMNLKGRYLSVSFNNLA